jgi:AcrR family transcriptional regulator
MPRGDFDRSARKAQTRTRLLEAAATVYARAGFNGATLDEVAAEAGYTKGAVYSHFGSKENLLVALMEEHLAEEIAEQIGLFDRGRETWERPLAGSASWMKRLEDDPAPFRLFVELWSYAQRDERLRERLAGGLEALRMMFVRFSEASAADAGLSQPAGAHDQFANVVLGLGIGLPMLRLIEPQSVSASLLGAVMAVLIRSAEGDERARALLADPDASLMSAG